MRNYGPGASIRLQFADPAITPEVSVVDQPNASWREAEHPLFLDPPFPPPPLLLLQSDSRPDINIRMSKMPRGR